MRTHFHFHRPTDPGTNFWPAVLVSPRIVVPADLLASGDAFALATVLRHESAHVSRGDAWLAAAMQLALVIFWPVLPLWVASWRVRQLIEVACDESALDASSPRERQRYGHTLLDLAELRAIPLHPMSAELHFGSTLRARIEALAWTRRWPLAVQAGMVGGVAVGFGACSSVAPTPDARSGMAEPPAVAHALWVAPMPDEIAPATGRTPVDKYCGPLVERVKARLPRSSDEFAHFGPDWVTTIESLWLNVRADDLPPPQVAFCRSAPGVLAADVSFWADEARNGIAQIGRDAVAAFDLRRDQGNATLCPSAPPIPSLPQAPNTPHRQTTPREWNDGAGFQCLRFSYSMPTYFQYRIDDDATHFKATAHAQRTIDGRLVDLTVALRGEVVGEELVLSQSLEETWKALD